MQASYEEQRKTAMAANVKAAEYEQIEGEVKRLDQYVHDMRHEVRNELQSITNKIDENGSELRQKIESLRTELDQRRSIGIGNLHNQLKETEKKVSAVATAAEFHTQQINQLDQKIERMPERVLALLTNRHPV